MSMVTLSWTVHTGYLLQEPQTLIINLNLTEGTMPDQVQGTTVKTGTCQIDPDHNLTLTDITAQVITIHTEATCSHHIRIIAATTGAAHDAHTPPIKVTAINPAVAHYTNHITGHPHIEVLQLTTPEITVDHKPSYKSSKQDLHRSHSSRSQGKPHLKKNPGVKVEDPPMEYYSSDEHSTDSGEEVSHLN